MTTEGEGTEPANTADPGTESVTERTFPDPEQLVKALLTVRDATARTRFPLELPGAKPMTPLASGIVSQIDDYLVPRLHDLDAALLTVVGGSTGAGKSTLVNSIVRSVVTPAGVLRPTTRSPVLVCHPDDVAAFSGTRVLPGLPRTTGAGAGTGHRTLQVVASESVEAGLAFLDSPDVDSVVDANRDLATELLGAADLWLFVTTAARYADAIPWESLHIAVERGTALALVLNRVPTNAEDEVVSHLGQLLSENGLADTRVFVLPESELTDGLLPDQVALPVVEWFTDLVGAPERRAAVVHRTVEGTIRSLRPRTAALADATDAQINAAGELRAVARSSYDEARSRVLTGIADGAVLRGEVLARWQEFVGAGDLLQTLESRVGRVREALTGARNQRGTALESALQVGLTRLVTEAAAQAAEHAVTGWRSRPGGQELLRRVGSELDRSSALFPGAVERLIRNWQDFILDLVRRKEGQQRAAPRPTASGVSGTALVVMVGVFTAAGTIPTGLEVVVASVTAALSRTLLDAVFNDRTVRELAVEAHADLITRIETVLATEEKRFHAVLAEACPEETLPAQLRAAALAVEAGRGVPGPKAAGPTRPAEPAPSPPGPAAGSGGMGATDTERAESTTPAENTEHVENTELAENPELAENARKAPPSRAATLPDGGQNGDPAARRDAAEERSR